MLLTAAAPSGAATSLTLEAARRWSDAWERARDRAAAARPERSAAVVQLVAEAVELCAARCAVPVVVELGAGTGALARRIAARSPGARVVALEADPVLLALARATGAGATGDGGGAGGAPVEVRRGRADDRRWLGALGHVDVVVASGALRGLGVTALAALYRDLAASLPPGGLLVAADHLPASTREVLLAPAGGGPQGDGVAQWWRAAARAPELAAAFADRGGAAPPPRRDHRISAPEHCRVLADLGFVRAEEVWRSGPRAVLAAWR